MTMPSDAHSSSSRRNDRMVAILAMLRDHDEVPLRAMAATLG
ncbi:MAG: alkaline phosphatase, partial [Cutibacterium avidum]|nr:alkaline phosphatase [Cutibacterium avidum]